jgi:hypothetical protein
LAVAHSIVEQHGGEMSVRILKSCGSMLE